MAFKYYNANPRGRHVNDCTIRAISLATNRSWDETYEELSRFAQAQAIMPDDIILSIYGEKINKIADISRIINSEENKGKPAEIIYKRNKELKNVLINPALDENSKMYKSNTNKNTKQKY